MGFNSSRDGAFKLAVLSNLHKVVDSTVVLILFGGSGSEIEVCKQLNRKFISAELDKKYYELILDRINTGLINEKYKLKFKGKSLQKEYITNSFS